MTLVQEYLELTKVCASTDYAHNKSVKLHNKSVNRMYEIAEKIGSGQTEETIKDFTKLLDVADNKTNVWAAVHILERIPVDTAIEARALEIIKQQANGGSPDRMGIIIWLENYKKNKTTTRQQHLNASRPSVLRSKQKW